MAQQQQRAAGRFRREGEASAGAEIETRRIAHQFDNHAIERRTARRIGRGLQQIERPT
jgi:hypothetical protein